MSEVSPGELRPDGWQRWLLLGSSLYATLALIFLVIVIPSGLRFVSSQESGVQVIPGHTVGDQRDATLNAMKSAATAQVSLFLNQDYHQAQATSQALIDGSTGELRKAYLDAAVTQINLAGELKTVAHGAIKKLAVMRFDPSKSGQLIVIATQEITNTKTKTIKKTAKCAAGTLCRNYRFLVTYENVGGAWKMSARESLSS